MVYNDKTSSFKDLLDKDKSVSIHTRNLQILATEMFKVHRNMSPPIVCEMFNRREINYDLCNFSEFSLPYVRSAHHGTDSISYLGPKIWELVPSELKELTSLYSFKNAIKKWKPSNCPCRLCKNYVQNVGFL